MSSNSTKSVNFGQASRLKYAEKVCRLCSKNLQIRVVSSNRNFQKLYYNCEVHRFDSWCHPIAEEEVHRDPFEVGSKADDKNLEMLMELKNLRIRYEEISRLMKIALFVLFIIMTLVCIIVVSPS